MSEILVLILKLWLKYKTTFNCQHSDQYCNIYDTIHNILRVFLSELCEYSQHSIVVNYGRKLL